MKKVVLDTNSKKRQGRTTTGPKKKKKKKFQAKEKEPVPSVEKMPGTED